MNNTTKKILFWSPRALCILFALFTTIFAFDVFGAGYDFWQTLLALAMHLIPTGIIVLFLVISWRWEWIGGILFLALAVFYVIWAWGRFPLSVYFLMSGPMIIISILFFTNWKYRTEIQTN